MPPRKSTSRGTRITTSSPTSVPGVCTAAAILVDAEDRFGDVVCQAVTSFWPLKATCTTGRYGSTAPLAQSVERFHGKEKVNGSIPLGGSADAERRRPRPRTGWAQR